VLQTHAHQWRPAAAPTADPLGLLPLPAKRSATRLALPLMVVLALAGCSESGNGNDKSIPSEHVWKNQVDAMERAKQVEQVLIDSQEKRRAAIEGMRQ